MKKELKDYEFPVHPVYNPRIGSNGKTVAEVSPSKRVIRIKKIEIGKQDSSSRRFLTDTLLHEKLESDIFLKRETDAKYAKLDKATKEQRHKWINNEIDRFFKKQGDKQ